MACGTGEVLARTDSVVSDLGKGLKRIDVTAFPLATEKDVVNILQSATGLPPKDILSIKPVSDILVGGRFRLTTRAAHEFVRRRSGDDFPIDTLKSCVDVSIDAHTARLNELIASFVNDVEPTRSAERLNTLLQVLIAGKFSRGRIPVTSSEDLCAVGIAASVTRGSFVVEEKFALDTIRDWFDANPLLASRAGFKQAVADLQALIQSRGSTSSGKGDLFENVLDHALLNKLLHGPVLDLRFLQLTDEQRTKLAPVWGDVVFSISHALTPFDEGLYNVAAILRERVNCLVSPEKAHRADQIANLNNVALFECGCKFYSSGVSSSTVLEQFRATDPRLAYFLADGSHVNSKATKRRDAWDAAQFPSRPVLRMHVSIPRAQVPTLSDVEEYQYKPGTFVLDQITIVVNVDATNLYLLLGKPDAAVEGDADTLRALYRILYLVTGCDEFNLKM